jgi:hypothetical protein
LNGGAAVGGQTGTFAIGIYPSANQSLTFDLDFGLCTGFNYVP